MEKAVIFLFVSMGIAFLVGAVVGVSMFISTWKELRDK